MKNSAYKRRRADFATWMAREGIAVAVFEDNERNRDPAVQYFTGHPCDAVLFITITGYGILCAWDDNLAAKADADIILPYTRFSLNPVMAGKYVIEKAGVPIHSKIEIPENTSYPGFLEYVNAFIDFDVICRKSGTSAAVESMRLVKDEEETALTRRACSIADGIASAIEKKIQAGQLKTESDVALFIEKEARLAGAEGTSFPTLAAGPSRSHMIHSYPPFGAGEFGTEGLSILDFGIKYNGYTSDMTLTFAAGALQPAQEKMISMVEKAYNEALELYKPGVSVREAALKADAVFARGRRKMPHGLGHGVGLAVHEAPFVRSRDTGEEPPVFQSGMIVTLEPGLYDPRYGGVRLENDVLITEEGNEVLTHSRIVRL